MHLKGGARYIDYLSFQLQRRLLNLTLLVHKSIFYISPS